MKYPSTQPSLLIRLQQGDEISWTDFYCLYAPVIICSGKYYGLCPDDCEDLVQQVMFKFFANSKSFTYRAGQTRFRSYFAKIIHNQIIDMARRRQTQMSLKNDVHMLYEDFHEVFMNEWRKTALAEAKAELRRRVDDKTYQAFELYGLQGRNPEQVADILDMSLSSLYTAKSRCVKMLNEIIERYNRTDGELNLEL